jgi:hypothetical protein
MRGCVLIVAMSFDALLAIRALLDVDMLQFSSDLFYGRSCIKRQSACTQIIPPVIPGILFEQTFYEEIWGRAIYYETRFRISEWFADTENAAPQHAFASGHGKVVQIVQLVLNSA